MRSRILAGLAAIAVSATLAACGSSDSGSSGNGGGSATAGAGNSDPIKIGVVADVTGPASSSFKTTEKGVEAYFKRINAAGGVNGHQIDYIMGDTTSTPAGALTATQKLWQNDHVIAIMQASSVFDGVVPYTAQQHIPVIAGTTAGSVWSNSKYSNTFVAAGVLNSSNYPKAQGQYMKAQGVKNCAVLGVSDASSKTAAESWAASCKAAGLQVTYINTQLTYATTDLGPVAIAIKNAQADGVLSALATSQSFKLVANLREQGVSPKSILLTTGYGSDLLQSSASIQAAQGVDFYTAGEPAEANTAATKQRADDLAAVGVTGPPSYGQQNGYLMASAATAGLKAAGANPTSGSLMNALAGIKDFDADGLLAPLKVNFRNYAPSQTCIWAARLSGQEFHVIEGTPVCAPTAKLDS
ncbi:ABC transporter substrate-binding protein [Pseudofrankia sp. BMG5.37]|uniref:ABC transporter substrate-binding protein n=1 Tax=Pseudofrankia sp. BMG5.37 TaxID=3050035 RepID=UPI002893A94B|nr:ABC transporter substrate-binding protein [Pseudofrankia sp. BMG5.37]MDT3439941.1 ABC transporter substrate-binding protein [Pseudofrankia sp. BMG5.37]